MNNDEERIYKKIKNELIGSVIDKKIDNYITNKNELTHYYNVGKMIIDAQGGEERAKYGDSLIKKFYLFQKGQPVVAQSISWSHYVILMSLTNINEINYYIEETNKYHLSKRIKKRLFGSNTGIYELYR